MSSSNQADSGTLKKHPKWFKLQIENLSNNTDENNIINSENSKEVIDSLITQLENDQPSDEFKNIPEKPICIYNFYNLDVLWRRELDAHRILLIEPSIFKKYPISKKSMDFMIKLSKNIKNIKIIVCEFHELPIKNSQVYFKEHPLNHNYIGNKDEREWIYKPENKFTSFFKHWNEVLKFL